MADAPARACRLLPLSLLRPWIRLPSSLPRRAAAPLPAPRLPAAAALRSAVRGARDVNAVIDLCRALRRVPDVEARTPRAQALLGALRPDHLTPQLYRQGLRPLGLSLARLWARSDVPAGFVDAVVRDLRADLRTDTRHGVGRLRLDELVRSRRLTGAHAAALVADLADARPALRTPFPPVRARGERLSPTALWGVGLRHVLALVPGLAPEDVVVLLRADRCALPTHDGALQLLAHPASGPEAWAHVAQTACSARRGARPRPTPDEHWTLDGEVLFWDALARHPELARHPTWLHEAHAMARALERPHAVLALLGTSGHEIDARTAAGSVVWALHRLLGDPAPATDAPEGPSLAQCLDGLPPGVVRRLPRVRVARWLTRLPRDARLALLGSLARARPSVAHRPETPRASDRSPDPGSRGGRGAARSAARRPA